MKQNYTKVPSFVAKFAENQATKNVLPFWQASAINPEGGLFGAVSKNGVADASATQGSIMNARALWSFAHAYECTGDDEYLSIADKLFDAFADQFVDQEYGGIYWTLDASGKPLEDHKHTVAQAYGLFAVSLYFQVSQNPQALSLAHNLVEITQKHFLRLDGTYMAQQSRSFEGESIDSKAITETCNQLHMLEALTQYIKSCNGEALTSHLEDLVDLFLLRIFPAQDHLALRFNRNWSATGVECSFGHNFEAGYLVYVASQLLNDDVRLAKAQKHLLRLVDYSIEHCKHSSGSYLFGIDDAGNRADTLFWWTQTEASNALITAAQLTQDQHYYAQLIELWTSIETHWVDQENGEWFSELDLSLKPAGNTNKVDLWRCCYHTTRACFYAALENQEENEQAIN